jgi:hypothetical protein
MTDTQQVFIISSSESLNVARAVKARLETGDMIVDVWDENTFHLNRGFVDELLNQASYYDFVVAIFTADDEARIRQRPVRTTRDNVIFEFGLFLGRLGLDRSFFILEEGVELFSDWYGRVVATYHPRANLEAAVSSACTRILREMDVASRLENFTMLPSTSLAIGYYNNFLSILFEEFRHTGTFSVQKRDAGGNLLANSETEYWIRDTYPTVRVRIPEDLRDLQSGNLGRIALGYQQVVVSTQRRSFPFYIEGKFDEHAQDLALFDVPTTLLTARTAIGKMFSRDFLVREDTRRRLEKREIENFKRTILALMPDDIESRYFGFSTLNGDHGVVGDH